MDSPEGSPSLSKAEIDRLALYGATVGRLHQYLKHVGRFPHVAQWEVANAFFREHKKVLFVQCGRKLGKSEAALYICWRYALEHPGAIIYIIAPTRKQGKDIYWTSKRLQYYGPQEVVHEHRDSELITVFKVANDEGVQSKIVIDGCDNVDSLRGINPDLVVYEEFRDHSREFDLNVMRPNLAAKAASLISISTPPDRACYYTEFRDEVIEAVRHDDPDYFYLELPTEANPKIDRKWLQKEKARLYRKGEGAVWEREYMAKFIPGGVNAVFPMYQSRRTELRRDPSYIQQVIHKDRKRLKWFTSCDPAQSCFGVLFFAINPYTSQIFIVDEIYERDRYMTSTGKIWPRILEVQKKHEPNLERWQTVADEAASWFRVEAWDRYHAAVYPTAKQLWAKKADISLIKDLLVEPRVLFISKVCENFDYEIANYVTDEEGDYIDEDDHLLDALRYGLRFSNFSVNVEVLAEDEENKKRPQTLGELIADRNRSADLYSAIESQAQEGIYLDDFLH